MNNQYRDRFELPSGIYLLSHSAGCLPSSARAAAAEYFDAWARGGGDAWGEWLEGIWDFRQALGRLLNAPAEDFCPQSNLSSALTKIIGSLPKREGRKKLVYSELDFPSCGFVCRQAVRLGYDPVMLPAREGDVPLEDWLAEIGEDTALVHITHVFSQNSRQLPVAEISAHCHRQGAFCVVDIAQSAGVVPIDIQAWSADFLTGSCLKWLCGGPGAGFMWVNPHIVDSLHPVDVGWFSHSEPFEFDITHFEYRSGALRFWGGTPTILPFAVAARCISEILDIGVPEIRRVNLAHTGRLMEAAQALGLQLSTPLGEHERGGTVALQFPDSAAAMTALQAAGIRCDSRPRSGVRLSPHIYLSEPEIAKVCAELGRLARQQGGARPGKAGQVTL